MPIVIRVPTAAESRRSSTTVNPPRPTSAMPGLKVVTCSNPADAYWMIQQAIASDDPIIFFEPKRRYHERAELEESQKPPPLHSARVARPGTDVTLIAYGPMVKTCLDAAEAATEEDHDLEVIDLRTLSPLDMAVVYESVQKTGRVITVHEATESRVGR